MIAYGLPASRWDEGVEDLLTAGARSNAFNLLTNNMITEESFIDFKCPHCDEPVSFPQSNAGHVRECPSCSGSLIVPEDGAEVGRKLPLPVTASRLSLRRFQPGDWQDLLELMPDAGEDYILSWLEREAHVRLTTPDQTFYLGIQLKDKEKLIGYFGLKFTDPERLQAALEYALNEKYRRDDFALEAADALLGFCFEGIKLHRVTAMCDSKDAAGCQLFEKLGMRREAEFIKDRFVAGEWCTSIWYAALAEEYLA